MIQFFKRLFCRKKIDKTGQILVLCPECNELKDSYSFSLHNEKRLCCYACYSGNRALEEELLNDQYAFFNAADRIWKKLGV